MSPGLGPVGQAPRGLVRRAGPALVAGLAALLAFAPPARAVTYAFQDYTCPLDGRPFSQGLPTPGRPLGSRLDLKPWGPVVAPAVLPVCPDSRFVLWKHQFSDEELARLRPFVASPAWQAIRDTETDYYRVARLRQWLGDDPVEVAFTLLYATWEVDEAPERYARYAQEALGAIDQALAASDAANASRPGSPSVAPPPDDERLATLRLVAVELQRRLGRFDQAGARLDRLAARAPFTEGTLHALWLQQRALVDAHDAAPHRMGEAPAR